MPVRRREEPQDDLSLEEQTPIGLGIVTSFQELEDVADPRPPGRFVLARRGDRKRLTAIFLRKAKETAIIHPAAVEPLHHQNPFPLERRDSRLRDGQSKRTGQ